MSSLETGHFRAVLIGLAVSVTAATMMVACTNVQPLYGTIGTDPSKGVQAQLRHVDFTVADSRISQHIRNELIFGFYGGEGSPDKVAYKLSIRVNESNVPVGIEKFQDLPSAYLEQLNATFTLVDTATQKTVLTGTSFANAAYDFSNQRFANVRAQRDAQDRAAVVIAGDIRTKVAAYFAGKP